MNYCLVQLFDPATDVYSTYLFEHKLISRIPLYCKRPFSNEIAYHVRYTPMPFSTAKKSESVNFVYTEYDLGYAFYYVTRSLTRNILSWL